MGARLNIFKQVLLPWYCRRESVVPNINKTPEEKNKNMMSCCNLSPSDLETKLVKSACWDQRKTSQTWRKTGKVGPASEKKSLEEIRGAAPFLLLIGYTLRSARKRVGSRVRARRAALVLARLSTCAARTAFAGKRVRLASEKHNYPISSGWPTNCTFIFTWNFSRAGKKL